MNAEPEMRLRVRGGVYYAEFRQDGQRVRRSTGCRDREAAPAMPDRVALCLGPALGAAWTTPRDEAPTREAVRAW